MSYVFRIFFTALGVIFGLLGLATGIADVLSADQRWHVVGQVWHQWSPTSLQVSEAIISRYIDPCGLFIALDCSPFLWHPVISTVLTWYAVPVFFVLAVIFLVIGRGWKILIPLSP